MVYFTRDGRGKGEATKEPDEKRKEPCSLHHDQIRDGAPGERRVGCLMASPKNGKERSERQDGPFRVCEGVMNIDKQGFSFFTTFFYKFWDIAL